MVFTEYEKQQMLILNRNGMSAPTITKVQAEGIQANKHGINKFLTHYTNTRMITRKPGSERKTIITDEIKRTVDSQMREDNT